MTKSIFAKTFGELVEATGGGVRWSARLGVTPHELDQWINDNGFPSDHVLRLFYGQIKESSYTTVEQNKKKQAFLEMLEMGSWDSCRGEARVAMHPSVGHYLMSSLRESLNMALATVSPDAQEKILCNAIRHCLKERT